MKLFFFVFVTTEQPLGMGCEQSKELTEIEDAKTLWTKAQGNDLVSAVIKIGWIHPCRWTVCILF